MDTRAERDTEVHTEGPEMYEPPMLDEIGEFTALTRADGEGPVADEFWYFPS